MKADRRRRKGFRGRGEGSWVETEEGSGGGGPGGRVEDCWGDRIRCGVPGYGERVAGMESVCRCGERVQGKGDGSRRHRSLD